MKTAYRKELAIHLVQKPDTRFGKIAVATAMAASIAIGLFLGMKPAQASEQAEAFVQETIDSGYAILNDASLSEDERFDQFQGFMLSLTDIRRIATFTLGPYVNRVPEAEVNDFVDAFTTYSVTVYEDRLSQYTGQTMQVTGSEDRAEDDSVVSARVVNASNPNAATINTAFRVRADEAGDPIVTDMQVEGVWLAISQRADFTSFLQRNNGSVAALAQSLRNQAQQIRAGG